MSKAQKFRVFYSYIDKNGATITSSTERVAETPVAASIAVRSGLKQFAKDDTCVVIKKTKVVRG